MPISAEAVEFYPAPAQAWNEQAGRKTKSSRTGPISPTAVVEPPLPTAGGGGGGWPMSTGGEEVRKLSAGRPLSAEAVEFSPAPATEHQRRSGRKTKSSGSSPTEVVELPLSKAGGGGGEVHGGGGGSQATLNGR